MRGYFGIGVESISKSGNLGNLVRSAHAMRANAVLFHGELAIAYSTTISVYIDEKSRKPHEIPQSLRDILLKTAG